MKNFLSTWSPQYGQCKLRTVLGLADNNTIAACLMANILPVNTADGEILDLGSSNKMLALSFVLFEAKLLSVLLWSRVELKCNFRDGSVVSGVSWSLLLPGVRWLELSLFETYFSLLRFLFFSFFADISCTLNKSSFPLTFCDGMVCSSSGKSLRLTIIPFSGLNHCVFRVLRW